MVFRCNGPHGEFIPDFPGDSPHYGYHIHTLKSDKDREMGSRTTTEYATYQDAISYFIKKCNINGADKHFSFLKNIGSDQQELRFDDE
jgi:hypothetical protein